MFKLQQMKYKNIQYQNKNHYYLFQQQTMQQQTIVSKLMSQADQRTAHRFNELITQGAYMNEAVGPGVNVRQIGGYVPVDPLQLAEQNQNLRAMLENIRSERSIISNPSIVISNPDEPTMTAEIEQAYMVNNQRIIELETVIRNQQVAIQEYQRGLLQVEANIENLRVLDSDIYKRLTERDTTQFENRIIEVKKALRSNAPYEVLFSMLNDIKI